MSDLIFVTGASGYLGSQVVDALLADKHNYRLRLAARGSKVNRLRASFEADPDAKGRVEVVEVSDVTSHDFTKDFEGVSALVHTAASVWTKASREDMIKDAVEGTLNVVRQAYEAGIRRVVYTSSVASMITDKPSGQPNDDWNPITKEVALTGHASQAYFFAKTESERQLWVYADARPELDITSVNPPYLYGPVGKHFSVEHLNITNLSTGVNLGALIDPNAEAFPDLSMWVDVRDIGRAHALALSSPLSSQAGIGRKRIFIGSLEDPDLESIRQLVLTERPELKDRVIKVDVPKEAVKRFAFDAERVEKVLGLKPAEYIPLRETILDTIDSLVGLEKRWIAEGAKAEDIPAWRFND